MKIIIAATHDEEYGLVVTLHKDAADAYAKLREVFLDGEYDPETEVDEDAAPDQIAWALDTIPFLTWSITEKEVPA